MGLIAAEVYRVQIFRCPNSGIIYSERWEDSYRNLHRMDGPALVERSRNTGIETRIAFSQNGQMHREKGEPAIQEFNEAGQLLFQVWAENGEYFRSGDLPHVEKLSPDTGNIVRAEYYLKTDKFKYKNYMLHRENGPAVLIFDPDTGQQIGVEYHCMGRKQKHHHFSPK